MRKPAEFAGRDCTFVVSIKSIEIAQLILHPRRILDFLVFKGKTYSITTNDSPSVNIETDKIPSSHEPKVLSERVHPDCIWEFRVPNTDVPAHTLSETLAGKVAEDSCCMDEDVSSLGFEVWEFWDTFDKLALIT
jgi:hypothetical protein